MDNIEWISLELTEEDKRMIEFYKKIREDFLLHVYSALKVPAEYLGRAEYGSARSTSLSLK